MPLKSAPLAGVTLRSSRHLSGNRTRLLLALALVLLLVVPVPTTSSPSTGITRNSGQGPNEEPPWPVWAPIDTISTLVEVPGGMTRVLRVNTTSMALEPVDWEDPVEALSGVRRQAVDRVPQWLRWDLARQLGRMGGGADRYARLIVDCPDDLWVDEIAFSVAHTPPEVLSQVANVAVLRDNVRYLYQQDDDLAYADLVERKGADGPYTTVSYINRTGVRMEQPRDVYYWYVAHARVFWEDPAVVSGMSFWRKAYYDEIEWEDSGTLASLLAGCADIYQAANASTVWMQMNMEFGYGTNPLQPVSVILSRYGSCGQYSITTASSLKVAMVPARVAIYPASDHQWCEVYLDGHWMHVDASSDVAGSANVKEPELVRLTTTVNFNDAGVFERGWKPYMSATSTFRSDDVVINSIGIRAPDPAISMRESGMEDRWLGTVHNYTDTSTVHVQVVDPQGDPVEAAYVGVFRIGHNIYDPSTPDYPHFAYANYTNATGGCEFELGLQGYCSRCGKDHTYGALVLSRYHTATGSLVEIPVKEEGREYTYTITISGDAPRQREPRWGTLPEIPWIPKLRLDLRGEAWGSQRHRHGEYGSSYETFAFGTTFDHVFPADVDVMVMDEDQLEVLQSGGSPAVRLAKRDAESFEGMVFVRSDRNAYLVLANTDTMSSTKVVNVTVDLVAECFPRMSLRHPLAGTDHSTDAPLVVNGTLFDRVPIETVQVSLDGGLNWTNVTANVTMANGTFQLTLDVTGMPSGEVTLVVRATDAVGVWREVDATIFLDADDPEVGLLWPGEGDVLPAGHGVDVSIRARDNREMVGLRVRMGDRAWVDVDVRDPPVDDVYQVHIAWDGEAGEASIEAEARDGVGRTGSDAIDFTFDPLAPMLELLSPEAGDTVLTGPVEFVAISGTVWDDFGVSNLSYYLDGDGPIDVTGTIGAGGRFTLSIAVSGWTDGEHVVMLVLEDLAGHADEAWVTFDLDTLPPALNFWSLEREYTVSEQVRISGGVGDAHGIEGVWMRVDSGPEVELPLDMAGTFASPLPSGVGAVGGHIVSLRLSDELGNEATKDLGYSVIDVTPPIVTVSSPASGAKVARGTTENIRGAVEDNVGVVSMSLVVGEDPPVDITDRIDRVMGLWDLDVATSGMDLGPLRLAIRAVDAAGNEVVERLELELVDRKSPVLELDWDPLRPPKAVRGRDVTLAGNATDDVAVQGVEYRIDGLFWTPAQGALSGSTLLMTVPTKGLSPGRHLLDVRVTDPSGNTAVESVTFVVKEPEDGGGTAWPYVVLAVVVLVVVLLLALLMPRSPLRGHPEAEASSPHGGTSEGDVEVSIEAEAPPQGPS